MNTMTAIFAALVLTSAFTFGGADSFNVEQVPVEPGRNVLVGENEMIGPPPTVEYQSKGGVTPECLACR